MKTTDLRRKKAVTSDPLPEYLLKTFEAYLPHVLGVTAPEHAPLVREATERFDAYVQSLPPHENARDDLEQLLFVTWLFGTFFRFPPRAPWKQAASRRRAFVEHFYSDDQTRMDTVVLRIADLGQALGVVVPRLRRKLKDFTLKDLAKSLREMMSLAFYSNPNADPSVTGYERIWDRSARYAHRHDVDRTALPRLRQPAVFDPKEAASIHQVGHPYDATRLFANDGRPKVAVIGTGAGGAVVAAKLAAEKKGGRPKYDVAVFDAGPRMSPGEYPLDTFVGMGRLFEAGLLTLTKDLDIHLLRGRVVGGGTVMTSGLSVRLRQGTKDAWTRTSGELAIGVGPEELDAGFEAVRERCHMAPMGELDPALYTDASHLLEEGAKTLGPDEPQWRFDADDAWNTVMMRASQHPGERPDQNGDWCFGCGLCNYGCHFGHKLSMDLTYVPDAIAAGAKLHPNLPIERLEGERDAHGQMQVTHLVLGRGLKARVKVDHVVLAAGAVGTPALLLRSAAHDPCWETLPPFRGDHVGTGLGFNYGSGVLGRWPTPFAKPGHFGFQIKYVATRAEDTPFEVKVSGEALANDPLR
ncbi:MAG TPA: GMC family oxidoreductase N-terminal domain-containing protein, partial [Polyangiaceae bacterium LLY-WYZ-15_(1-7)]|nr:GMC family oxidoreductase N-terminal domain-containing protein [Polyangiaceae bacterium LLY-WYZ-15_(1-7)]